MALLAKVLHDFSSDKSSAANDDDFHVVLLIRTMRISVASISYFTGSAAAISSCDATICQRPFRFTHTSVQTNLPFRGSLVRRSQDSLPCATAVLPKNLIFEGASKRQ